jgi:hypothetical protein
VSRPRGVPPQATGSTTTWPNIPLCVHRRKDLVAVRPCRLFTEAWLYLEDLKPADICPAQGLTFDRR